MANQYEDDEDDLIQDEQQSNDGPANLRKALKKEQKEKAELQTRLAQLEAESRSRSVKEVLAAQGVPDKIAKFIPSDVSTPEQVDAWLKENADVFGLAPAATEQASEETVANKAAYQRINAATQNVNTPSRSADLLAQVEGAKTRAELDALAGIKRLGRNHSA